MMKVTTDATFAEDVLQSGVPVLVDVWAEWCGPCRAMLPILESLSTQFGERLVITKLNADEEPETVKSLGITSIPTMLLYVNGEVVQRISGAKPRGAIEAILSQHVILDM